MARIDRISTPDSNHAHPRIHAQTPLRRLTRWAVVLGVLLAAGSAGAANFGVNSTDDDGDMAPGDGTCWTGGWVVSGRFGVYECTLRAAIEETNALAGADSIGFSSRLVPNIYGRVIFAPFSAYPVITSPLTIDGTTLPDYDEADPEAHPLVVLDGSFLGGSAIPGLTLGETADGSVVRGLTIIAFPAHGISVGGADSVLIEGNHIGVNRGVIPDGNGGSGVYVYSFSDSATIGQRLNPLTGFEGRPNVISANAHHGVVVQGNGSAVRGNLIGTDPTGNATDSLWGDLGNGMYGIDVAGNAANAAIGDVYQLPLTTVWYTAGNTIAGNGQGGVRVHATSPSIAIEANRVGIGADGSTALGNGVGSGIRIHTSGVVVGGDGGDGVRGNTVSGHQANGIEVFGQGGASVQNVEILGNRVGVDATASFPVPNAGTGIALTGGTGAEIAHNVVGGNDRGIFLWNANYGSVYGNFIGTNASRADLGNAEDGLVVRSISTEIGRPFEPNVIGFNRDGIALGAGNTEADVRANWIGADTAGNTFGNTRHGLVVIGANNYVGGNGLEYANVIGANGEDGIHFEPGVYSADIVGNYVGTNSLGADLGNGGHGIRLDTATETTIGEYVGVGVALNPSRGNHIAFNGGIGVLVSGTRNAIRGNVFGSNAQLPIDLGGDGPTPNDYLDEDTGPNWRQNTPVLDAAHTSYDGLAGMIDARYRVDSWGDSVFPLVIDFYVVGPDGAEPGAWLGADMYLWADATLDRDVSFAPVIPLTGTESIVAVATDGDGNSSEVGQAVPLPEPGLATALCAGIGFLAAFGRRGGDGIAARC